MLQWASSAGHSGSARRGTLSKPALLQQCVGLWLHLQLHRGPAAAYHDKLQPTPRHLPLGFSSGPTALLQPVETLFYGYKKNGAVKTANVTQGEGKPST